MDNCVPSAFISSSFVHQAKVHKHNSKSHHARSLRLSRHNISSTTTKIWLVSPYGSPESVLSWTIKIARCLQNRSHCEWRRWVRYMESSPTRNFAVESGGGGDEEWLGLWSFYLCLLSTPTSFWGKNFWTANSRPHHLRTRGLVAVSLTWTSHLCACCFFYKSQDFLRMKGCTGTMNNRCDPLIYWQWQGGFCSQDQKPYSIGKIARLESTPSGQLWQQQEDDTDRRSRETCIRFLNFAIIRD